MEISTKQSTNEQTNDFTPFDTNRIPESEYQKYGIKPENLEGELKAMSYGYKSPHLVDINPNIDGVDYPMKARLSLEEQPDGSLKFIPHPYQQQVDLDKPFQGVMQPNERKLVGNRKCRTCRRITVKRRKSTVVGIYRQTYHPFGSRAT